MNVSFKCDCHFIADKNGILHGFGGYFISTLSKSIVLDTSPGSHTHWRQHFFPLDQPIKITCGDKINFKLEPILEIGLVDWCWTIEVNEKRLKSFDTRGGIRIKEEIK